MKPATFLNSNRTSIKFLKLALLAPFTVIGLAWCASPAKAAFYSFTSRTGGSNFTYQNGANAGELTGVFELEGLNSNGTSDTNSTSGNYYANVTATSGPTSDGAGNNKWNGSGTRTFNRWFYDYSSSDPIRYLWFYNSAANDSLRLTLTTSSGLNTQLANLTFSAAFFYTCDVPSQSSNTTSYSCGGAKFAELTGITSTDYAVRYVPSPGIISGLIPLAVLFWLRIGKARRSMIPAKQKVLNFAD